MEKISLNRDYKPEREKTEPAPFPYRHYLFTAAGILAGMGIFFGLTPDTVEATRTTPVPVAAVPAPPAETAPGSKTVSMGMTEPRAAALHTSPATPPATISTPKSTPRSTLAAGRKSGATPHGRWHTAKVKRGDNLSLIFKRRGLSARQLQQILSLGEEPRRILKRLYPGDVLRLNIDAEGRLQQLVYDYDDTRTLEITRQGEAFSARLIEREAERRISHASGIINDSLFLAAQRAGLSDNITMELAAIFGWDIDFSLDIREGDSFTVIYEELYLDGEKLRDGEILAAEFINRGKVHRAIRFTDAGGRTDYYSPDGRSMRKAFLRSPVAFTRVSSRFSLGRRHPILNKIRAHKGVDYAAPRGTPVKATGDGRIVHRGTKGGYGKTVIIEHGSRYHTLYAHLSRYARGIRSGRRVRQGQVIGYVGSTGLATGPHLHYEFRVNGVHRNPLTVRLPDAAPLPRRYLAEFTASAKPYLAQLDLLRRSTLALNEERDAERK